MPRPTIGDQELALLHYLSENGGASVGEVAGGFGEPRGLARSTVLTMMERLRGKGYLKRRQLRGMFRYSTATGPKEAMRRAVGSFVEKTLSGSVSLTSACSDIHATNGETELAELEALVAQLQTRRKES
jgi:predicted transcriptional regulator